MSHPAEHANETAARERANSVASLVVALGDKDVLTRQAARERLAAIGSPAVPALARALGHRRSVVRWEAAKTLEDIADPSAAPSLVTALEDRDAGVRWLAAEALIAIGREGVPPLLNALIERSDSEWMREGAHHVLRHFIHQPWGKRLAAVLKAIEGIVPHLEAPLAACVALRALKEGR
jgi:HEAT repeat protein